MMMMIMGFRCAVLWLVVSAVTLSSQQSFSEEELIAQSESGPLRAAEMASSDGRPFLAFLGVPYAEPPVGQLRFQDPKEVAPWKDVMNATQEAPACLQYDEQLLDFRGSEDCLHLNIYTHSVGDARKPVVVFFHGGGWSTGSGNGESDVYNPDTFMHRDVVLVTVNYRLSALGFLSTEDSLAPGNYGLLDQVMALRWVKDNTRHFGGDPDSITVIGQSSGAGGVHSHVLSPRTKGLFARAIVMSGNSLCPWATFKYVRFYTELLARHLDCPVDSSEAILSCLRTKDAKEIAQFRKTIEIIDYTPAGFGPRVDSERDEPYLPREPLDILESGSFNRVPLITGVAANEGAWAAARLSSQGDEMIRMLESNFTVIFQNIIGRELETNLTDAIVQVRRNYFGNSTALDLNVLENLISDSMFFQCTVDAIRIHSHFATSDAPIYSYYYAHRGLFTFPMLYAPGSEVEYGVSHGDDILILFSIPLPPPLALVSDQRTQDILLDLWTSFAATGVPKTALSSVQWSPNESNQRKYLIIKNGDIALASGDYPFQGRISKLRPILN